MPSSTGIVCTLARPPPQVKRNSLYHRKLHDLSMLGIVVGRNEREALLLREHFVVMGCPRLWRWRLLRPQ